MSDKCDCCKAEMKYPKLGKPGLNACEECRETAMKALGVSVTSIHVGPRK